MRRRNRRWIALLVGLLVLTAGCSGAGGDSGGSDDLLAGEDDQAAAERQTEVAEATPMATGTPREAQGAESDGGDGKVEDAEARAFAERQLVFTGHVAIEVQDFESARRNLSAATQSYGGFVSDTRQEVNRIDNATWTEGQLVLRVPRENFSALYERARAEGELIEARRNSEDVTGQLVDIRARLENLRAERDQLRELYNRANETEDVLEVQERLSEVQGEIERLEARQESLRQRVALSTITVRIREPRPEPDRPAPDAWYDIGLLAAFLESVNGVVVTVRALAVAIAYAIPYVLAFGVPLSVLGYVLRRRGVGGSGRLRRWFSRRRNQGPTSPSSVAKQTGDDEDGNEQSNGADDAEK